MLAKILHLHGRWKEREIYGRFNGFGGVVAPCANTIFLQEQLLSFSVSPPATFERAQGPPSIIVRLAMRVFARPACVPARG